MNKYGKNPCYGYAWRLALRKRHLGDEAFLQAAYPSPVSTSTVAADLKEFWKELGEFSELRQSIEKHKDVMHADYDQLILSTTVWLPLLYCLIRVRRPQIVVETGCATGTTASLILYGLERNGSGHLHTIDVPAPGNWMVRAGLTTGFLIPERLKTHWSLTLKDAKVALPELLHKLGAVDLFYHDSDHSYVHQMWELLTAWPYLTTNGLLASDDLKDNTALFDLARQVPGSLRVTSRQDNFGFIVKA